ncbi:MAG: glycerate kinase [Sporolactobacillus sp.]|jgi:glycerate kinase|nr:glycerate kinase [Sporolactobacillus sp.]
MNVFVAIDSFKGCADSLELGRAAERGIRTVRPDANVKVMHVGDGGEGSAAAVYRAIGGQWREVRSVDPFFRPIHTRYLVTHDGAEPIALIESAQIIGLDRAADSPAFSSYQASSYGLGRVLCAALSGKINHIVISLGGSLTTDGGLGLLQALGAKLLDRAGKPIDPQRNPLIDAAGVELEPARQRVRDVEIEVMADVGNPYAGPAGAARMFGPQKHLNDRQVADLDQKLLMIRDSLLKTDGIDLQQIRGAGAAGGLGGALALLGAHIVPGFTHIAQLIHLEDHLQQADLVLTGEGSLDGQSAYGKVPFAIAKLARHHGIPCVALCGRRDRDLGPMRSLFTAAFSIQLGAVPPETAMRKEVALAGTATVTAELIKLLQVRSLNESIKNNGC